MLRHRRPSLFALGAASGVAAGLVLVIAFLTRLGARVDERVYEAIGQAGAQAPRPRIENVAVLADPLPFVLTALALAGIALLRGRIVLAALVPVILLAASATTQALQEAVPRLLERADPGGDQLAWPSGHATAAMSLALCGVLVASPRSRPVAAMLGAGYAVAVGYAQIALGSHLPSDVLGGYLLAASFVLSGVAVLKLLEGDHARAPARFGTPVVAPVIGALVVIGAATATVFLKGSDPLALAQQAPALAAGASIAALGVILIAALGVALGVSERAS